MPRFIVLHTTTAAAAAAAAAAALTKVLLLLYTHAYSIYPYHETSFF